MNDVAVLEYLFNPLMQSPIQAEVYIQHESEGHHVEGDISDLDENLLVTVKEMEMHGVLAAKAGDFDVALERLGSAIEMAPRYSSLYNNRAQVYRLLQRYHDARADLDVAIQHSDPSSNGMNPINIRVAKLAYAQRGFLLKGFLDQEGLGEEDLQRAAKLGHSLAALETNPFRTLCGNMVSIMMKEQCGIDV